MTFLADDAKNGIARDGEQSPHPLYRWGADQGAPGWHREAILPARHLQFRLPHLLEKDSVEAMKPLLAESVSANVASFENRLHKCVRRVRVEHDVYLGRHLVRQVEKLPSRRDGHEKLAGAFLNR